MADLGGFSSCAVGRERCGVGGLRSLDFDAHDLGSHTRESVYHRPDHVHRDGRTGRPDLSCVASPPPCRADTLRLIWASNWCVCGAAAGVVLGLLSGVLFWLIGIWRNNDIRGSTA